MKERKSPLDPLVRKKAKGKENKPLLCEKPFKPARARRACTCTYAEAGCAVDEILGNCFGGPGDVALWAWYCRHFDRERIVDRAYEYAALERQGEIRNGIASFQKWLSRTFGSPVRHCR